MPSTIETFGLTRYFGANVGIRDLNLTVPEGEIFGFLGPNGAGKTTTIRLLMNFIRPNRGKMLIFGKAIRWGDFAYHRDMGFFPGEVVLPGNYTGEALLNLWASLSGKLVSGRELMLDTLAFSQRDLGRRIREYSRGMKQKLALVGAMQHLPRLLILDEPTNGLDPLVKHTFLGMLKDLKFQGCTIFFSSHNLSEVEQIADRTAIIRQGKLVVEASIEELKRKYHKTVEIIFRKEEDISAFLSRYQCPYKKMHLRLTFLLQDNLNHLLSSFNGLEIDDMTISTATLEDIFLQYYEDTD